MACYQKEEKGCNMFTIANSLASNFFKIPAFC